MVGSGVWAGNIPLEKAHDLKEVGNNRRTIKEELERIGYLGTKEADYNAIPLGVYCRNRPLLMSVANNIRLILNCILVSTCPT